MNLEAEVMACVAQALALSPQAAAQLQRDTGLQGSHPDFSSMTVLELITALEERLDMPVADELHADALLTVGSLIDHLTAQRGG